MSASNLPDNALLQWLQDEANNDYLEPSSIESMYQIFADGREEDQLDLLKDDDRHHCFLIFSPNEEDKPTSTILHHMAKYPKRIGVTTNYDGRWYVAANEPVGGNQITYEVPDDIFDACNDIQVYTPDRLQREIGNDPSLTIVPMLVNDENVADIEQVNTCRGMWLPNQYAALCLENGLSPVEVWSRLYGQILQDGTTRICKPLITFLRVQVLGDVMLNAAIYDPSELVVPRPSISFHRHRGKVMEHLKATPVGGNATATAPASGLSAADFQKIVVALRQGHGAPPATVASSPKTTEDAIRKRWSVNLDSLLLVTLSKDVNELEPIFGSIAEGGRKMEKTVLQSGYNSIARSTDSATPAILAVTKELTSTITEVVFWSGDLDRTDEGIHEFRTLYHSASKVSQDQSAMQTYDLLAADGNLSLADVKLFRHVLKSRWPTNFLQLDTTIRVHMNLLALILRPSHPLRAAYQRFIHQWGSMTLQLAEQFNSIPAMASKFLRSLQLRTSIYWQSVTSLPFNQALMHPAPNYVELLNKLLIQDWVPPAVPGYTAPALESGRANAGTATQTGSGVGAGAGAGSGAGNGGGNGGEGTGGDGGGTPRGTMSGGAGGPTGNQQRREENNDRDPVLVEAMDGRQLRLGSLFTGTVRPPRTAAGQEICCAFHLNGCCFSNCRRKSTHGILVAEDRETLREFVQEHIVTPNLGRPAASA